MAGVPTELIAMLVVAAIAALLRLEWQLARRRAAFADWALESAAASVGFDWSGEAFNEPDPERMPIEADGHVWLPDRHAVHRFSLFAPDALFEDEPRVVAGSLSRREFFERRPEMNGGRAPWLPSTMGAGDYTGARVVRGELGLDPWRLEALGPDGEYVAYAFESEADAHAAFRLLESRRVVKRPHDPDGTPIPASYGDFEEARLRWERTIEQLVRSLVQPEPPLSC